ncbi:hypothetical protein CC85DRAFT_309759 [Cutaneotrichosporon oleaginosum]|uniref:Oxo-4-hydroxy-4-carboxy-5-ureidoimidazoline decarboxylase domain-containing protein n=1 Tax=Cutaneotrichosporon oleaginosum TaxID=879819 RepID=A0A0J0XCI2_9TREE|nr:uncharacterized protein CC85DRAFT_309759 [Cutaneotrichosporon oleaginosum]KLT38762.1 hypothetical protein CC85DRAFT_309759 [Cutaneotrichosporon oleaginosum]TXT11525.1 hypothetical protein COLE_01935 [Cutaneotrichosporon oleaginosum]
MSWPATLDFATLTDSERLTALLGTLFEPTPPLRRVLVPAVLFRASTAPPASYAALVDLCAAIGADWDWDTKAQFIQGHPVIGEVKGLSAHSSKEQGSGTPAVVLDRLAHLNAVYEAVWPGLRFITFVAGRPRAAIVNEMEANIGIAQSPQPLPDTYDTREPALGSSTVQRLTREKYSDEWKSECDRALVDVWRIGHARLGNMGLE